MKIRGIVIILIILFGSLYLPLTINQKLVSVISTPFPKSPISWLAAGDSYSSGQGLTYRTGKCAQGLATNGNLGAWPMEAANNLMSYGLKLVNKKPKFVACTGAATDQFFTKNDNAGYPEWNPSMGKFDLVTFTFGGDNIGFSNLITSCILHLVDHDWWENYTALSCPSYNSVASTISSQISGINSAYGKFLSEVADKVVNKGGNIVVLGYPIIMESPQFWPLYAQDLRMCQGIDIIDADEIRELGTLLNTTLALTVQEINNEHINGVHLTFVNVNTGDPSQGIPYNDPNLFEPSQGARHNLCAAQEWLNGITPYSGHFSLKCVPVSCVSFHPNQEGNTAMANLFEQVFPRLDWSGLKLSSGLLTPVILSSQVLSGLSFGPPWGSVSCGGPSACVAIDSDGGTEEWNGRTWAVKQTILKPLGGDHVWWQGLSCGSATMCMAIGNASPLTSQTPGTLMSYSAEFNGIYWSRPILIQTVQEYPDSYNSLSVINCKSVNFCMTLGARYPYVWNGKTWRKLLGLNPVGQDGGTELTCTSPFFCMAAPAFSNVDIWNGSKWYPSPPSLSFTDSYFNNLSCSTPDMCLATVTSREGAPNIYRWNGISWKSIPIDGFSLDCVKNQSLCLDVNVSAYVINENGNLIRQTSLLAIGISKISRTISMPSITQDDILELSCMSNNTCMVLLDTKAFLVSIGRSS